MIPGGEGAPKAPFPYVGLATALLLVHAILVAIIPSNPYRAAVALAALLGMGYCTLALIVGDKIRLSAAEILAFSTGFMIFVTSLSALGVSVLGVPITVFAVVIVGLPISVLAWFTRRPGGFSFGSIPAFARGLFDFSDYSGTEKGIAAVLFAGIIAALVVLVSLYLVHYPDVVSPGLTLTGPDGTLDTLPSLFITGEPQTINVAAFAGSLSGAFTVRIALVPQTATGNETFHVIPESSPLHFDAFGEYRVSIVLGIGESWERQFSISIETVGKFYIRFMLLDAGGADLASNRLPVQAA